MGDSACPTAFRRGRRAGGGAHSSDWVLGVVVDDYSAEAGVGAGHDWAPVRRWAVAADDGRLVFADDGDVEAARPEGS
ncbi:hypothetical protein ACFVKB_45775 [Rhodococcus sp. NPDC127530]|uniref:hypothetical protein n=1 Tax=unclassified Rhodococcus (in: high G+C Gram-positive bacteria) TaxID=192944 RepID=UPI0036327E7B